MAVASPLDRALKLPSPHSGLEIRRSFLLGFIGSMGLKIGLRFFGIDLHLSCVLQKYRPGPHAYTVLAAATRVVCTSKVC